MTRPLILLALVAALAACEADAPPGAAFPAVPGPSVTADGCRGPIEADPALALSVREGGACASCAYPPLPFLPRLPFPQGVSMGVSQSWCCQCNGCLGGGCTSHGGSTSYALDFTINGGNDCGVHVLAAEGGTVTEVRADVTCEDCEAEGYGNFVVVDHGGGIRSRYAHLQFGSVKVSKGQAVCQGQHLGSIGSTGWSTGCHLHFQFEGADGASVPFSKFAETPAVPICNLSSNPYTSKNPEVTTCDGGPVTGCSKKANAADWLVIDDLDPCFEKKNTWYVQSVGYGGQSHFTYSWGGTKTPDTGPNAGQSDSTCAWTFAVEEGGQYELQVFVPKDGATSQQVKYHVEAPLSGTFYVTIDQSTVFDDWVPLGTFPVQPAAPLVLRLFDNTGEPQLARKVAADAARLRHIGPSCEAACLLGATECATGSSVRVCEDTASGCPQWSPAVSCDDGDPCTSSTCSSGACQPAKSGTACSDGDPCTVDDVCVGATCAGAPLGCDDGEPCTTDACEAGACVHEPLTGACDDGDPCTLDDVCASGVCTGEALGCDDGNACTIDGCVGTECTHTPTASLCDDGDPCTANDTCATGVCQGEPVSCDAWADDCNDAECVGGLCEQLPRTDVPCDDGDACTSGDTCKGGVCIGVPLDCTALAGDCTTGVCKAGACVAKPKWVPCDDKDPCTFNDFCVSGACVGVALACEALSDTCNQGSCVEGVCVALPLVQTPCDDGRACTGGDQCGGGSCTGTVTEPCCGTDWDCNDDIFCTVDRCTDGAACANQRVKAPSCCMVDAECATGDPCRPAVCTDHVCVVTELSAPHCCHGHAACNDGDPFTMDACVGSSCTSGPWPGACTTDSECVAVGACVSSLCTDGACVPVALPGCCLADANCDDGVSCTVDRCDDGQCVFESRCCKDESACDDGDACTTDACVLGACVNEPTCCEAGAACDDGDPCTADSCTGGFCVHVEPACEGLACSEDGCCGPCAIGSVCEGGACVAAGCAGVGLSGLCDGALLRSCEGETIMTTDCAQSGQGCGLVDESGAYGCCTPSCHDRACGGDGCGGSCGVCAAGMQCTVGQCVPLGVALPETGGGDSDTGAATDAGGVSDASPGSEWKPPTPDAVPDEVGAGSGGGCSGSPGAPEAGWPWAALLVVWGLGRRARWKRLRCDPTS